MSSIIKKFIKAEVIIVVRDDNGHDLREDQIANEIAEHETFINSLPLHHSSDNNGIVSSIRLHLKGEVK